MSSRRHPNVVNLDELEPATREIGTRFGGQVKPLGVQTGRSAIGCNYFEIPPGRSLCPFHWHAANEESIFILEGEGTMRIGDDEVAVRAGDYIAFPVGPDHAHQLVNTSDAAIRYLCFSTGEDIEIVGYPDSNKVAAIAVAPDSPPWPDQNRWVSSWFPADADVDYFHGEDIGEEKGE